MNIWRRKWQPTPVLLPGKSHRRRSLVGCSPWGHEELDTTKRLHFDFSLSFIGEGSGNPLQCSCLENPRDRGAWWAAVYGVTQSRTQLKRLSSSSSSSRVDLKSWTFLPGDAANSGPHFKFKKKNQLNKTVTLLDLLLISEYLLSNWNKHLNKILNKNFLVSFMC